MRYDYYYEKAQELLTHLKEENISEEWCQRCNEVFGTETTLSEEDADKLVALVAGRDVESVTNAEKAVYLMLCSGVTLEEAVTLKHSNFLREQTGDNIATFLCFPEEQNGIKGISRLIPISLLLYVLATGLPGRNRKEEDVYVVGMSETPVDIDHLSDEVYELFKKTEVLNEDVLIHLAALNIREKETLGKQAIEEKNLLEYLLRRTFVKDYLAKGFTEEQVGYMLGLEPDAFTE